MKKIIFPFYNKERHNFLFGKWLFRMAIVFYIVIILIIPVVSFNEFMNPYLSCYDTVIKIYEHGSSAYNTEFENCKINVYEAMVPAVGYSIVLTLAFHYFIQLIFFKIITNYIILGNKK